jgi:hypothetical protein
MVLKSSGRMRAKSHGIRLSRRSFPILHRPLMRPHQRIFKALHPRFSRAPRNLDCCKSGQGYSVRTAPDWSLLIRPVVNYPPSRNFDLYEGVVESDRWFGPLFTNLRLAKRDHPIHFGTEMPLFQVQAMPRVAHAESTHKRVSLVEGLSAFSPADWLDYEATIVKPNRDPERRIGAYAARTRKRGRT